MQGTAGVIQGARRITAIVDGLAKHLGLKMALKKCFTWPIIKLDASVECISAFTATLPALFDTTLFDSAYNDEVDLVVPRRSAE